MEEQTVIRTLAEETVVPKSKAFDMIIKNDIDGLTKLISLQKLEVDSFDENGMTPLQHACYKGNKEIAQMLLDQGADVNSGQHEHGYTALHFAALAGNADLCQLLLSAGAKSHATNSVGRTAAQMAAFVGNHSCVAIINNFIPRADVDYYTVPHGVADKPHLAAFLAAPLHKFIMHVNINPVRVALNLHGILLEHIDQVKTVLEMMRDREARRGPETNEITAFKFHYLCFVAAEVARIQKRQKQQRETEKKNTTKKVLESCEEQKTSELVDNEKEKEKKSDAVELFIKNMLKTARAGESHTAELQERFLRECVRDYPYRESNLLRQMVASLAPKDSPSAISVISAAINGQRGFSDFTSSACSTCGEEKAPKKCSKCKAVQYCDRECQRLHWFLHKKACARLGSSGCLTVINSNLSTDISIIQNEKSGGPQLASFTEQNKSVVASASGNQLISQTLSHGQEIDTTCTDVKKDEE